MKYIVLALLIPFSFLFSQVKFDADFESGNINTVLTIDSVNYTVTTNEDIGGRWFYFRISGVLNRLISVTVSNSDVTRAMYSYDNENFVRFSAAESPTNNKFQKTFENDTVYVAYYTPYTYSFLEQRINEWKLNPNVRVDTLGYTPHNFPLREIIVTDSSVPDDQKERVWVHARIHPGETPASWHFDGLIETLLQNDEVIDHFRKNIVFHLIPFTNPDGVYYGRSRTNFNYIDLERDWASPVTEEISVLKFRLAQVNSIKPVKVFLNLHSQAASYCTFWIHTAASTSDYFYRREHQFSNLNVSGVPWFTQSDFRYSALQSYFAEGWLWNYYGDQVMALTYETPYSYYSNGEWVTNENLAQLGRRTVYSIAEYLELSHPKYAILDNKNAEVTGTWNAADDGLQFFSDNYYASVPGDGSSKVIFSTEELSPGKYEVWAWWPSNDQFSFNTKFQVMGSELTEVVKTQKVSGGQWNFISETILDREGKISITLDNSSSGIVAADAFRIIFLEPVVTSLKEKPLLSGYKLYQNYPNPFNPNTTIRYEVPVESNVNVTIYNTVGEVVGEIVNETRGSGTYEVNFSSAGLASGVYYYRMSAVSLDDGKRFSETKKMIILK
jgi:hypothetical protein